MPNTENTDTQNVSEEILLEQQFNDLLLELNHNNQNDYFTCQKEFNTLTKEYILSISYKSNICVLALTKYTQQTPDHTKTISTHLDIDFLLDSIASTFVLSAAINSRLQSNGTIKLTLYPDVSECRTLKNTSFTLTFHVSNTKFNILGTPFQEKYVDSIKCSSHKR